MMQQKLRLQGLCLLLASMLSMQTLQAQEPAYMQFNADPLNINPALAGRFDIDFRAMVNARSQWLGKTSMYNTRSVSLDGKVFQLGEKNFFGLGGNFLSDNAMDGLFKRNFYSVNGSYRMTLGENGSGIALGIGIVGNNTRMDYSQLSFDQQLSSSGFDMTLASGETSLNGKNNFTSASAGLLYTFENDIVYFDIGFAGYRFMTFTSSMYNDVKQKVYPRYSANAYLSATLTDRLSIQASVVNMLMENRNMLYAGAMFGLIMSDYYSSTMQMIHLGSYYRSSGALAPCIGYTHGNIDIGLSYDVNISKSASRSVVNRALELTLAYNVFSQNSSRGGR